jgi:hypothetical protein
MFEGNGAKTALEFQLETYEAGLKKLEEAPTTSVCGAAHFAVLEASRCILRGGVAKIKWDQQKQVAEAEDKRKMMFLAKQKVVALVVILIILGILSAPPTLSAWLKLFHSSAPTEEVDNGKGNSHLYVGGPRSGG